MARWEPDARGRLEKAALSLFQERGYVQTTVQDIAAHAGLTERTFFRHFSDKREVLFSGSQKLADVIAQTVASAPREASPLETVGQAFMAAAASLQAIRELSDVRVRHALLVEHAELRERELIKMATLAEVVTSALRARKVAEPGASMAAQVGVAAFKVGFERWVEGKKPNDFAAHVGAALRSLGEFTSDSAEATPVPPARAPRARR